MRYTNNLDGNVSAVEFLDIASNYFQHDDWKFTPNHNITEIRYNNKYDKTNRFFTRLRRAIRYGFGPTPSWMKQLNINDSFWERIYNRLGTAWVILQRDRNLPDGSLDGGNIITYWAEIGEYIQLMQPSVGSLLAEFLKEEPENKHAVLIIEELERIISNYDE